MNSNDDYQQRAREEQRRRDEEAHRKSLEDYARQQRERQERQDQEDIRANSRFRGQMGLGPPVAGGVAAGAHLQGKMEHDAWKKMWEGINPKPSHSQYSTRSGGAAAFHATPAYSGGHISSGYRRKRSAIGKFFRFIFRAGLTVIGLIIALIFGAAYLGSNHSNYSSSGSSYSASSESSTTPAVPAAQPKAERHEDVAQAPASDRTAVPVFHHDAAPEPTPQQDNFASAPVAASPKPPVKAGGFAAPSAATANSAATPRSTSGMGFGSVAAAPSSALPNAGASTTRRYYTTWHNPNGAWSGFGSQYNTLRPWPESGVRYRAHHKGGNGCNGQLALLYSGLEFSCDNNPQKSFSVSMNEVASVDNDGIATNEGKKHQKYHFDHIGFEDKNGVRRLFEQWLEGTHAVPYPNQ